MKYIKFMVASALVSMLTGCGGEIVIDKTCDEPQRYQAVSAGNRLAVPEGLDPLNEFAEMPIPSAEGAPERPPGSRCIELPPAIGTSRD